MPYWIPLKSTSRAAMMNFEVEVITELECRLRLWPAIFARAESRVGILNKNQTQSQF